MSRKKRKMLKRDIQPDLKHNSVLLMKFINHRRNHNGGHFAGLSLIA